MTAVGTTLWGRKEVNRLGVLQLELSVAALCFSLVAAVFEAMDGSVLLLAWFRFLRSLCAQLGDSREGMRYMLGCGGDHACYVCVITTVVRAHRLIQCQRPL